MNQGKGKRYNQIYNNIYLCWSSIFQCFMGSTWPNVCIWSNIWSLYSYIFNVKKLRYAFKGQMRYILALVSPAFRVNHIQYFCLTRVRFSSGLHVLPSLFHIVLFQRFVLRFKIIVPTWTKLICDNMYLILLSITLSPSCW